MDLAIAMVVESSSADVRSSAVAQRQHHRETAGETAPGETAQRTSVGCQKLFFKKNIFLYQGCFSVIQHRNWPLTSTILLYGYEKKDFFHGLYGYENKDFLWSY